MKIHSWESMLNKANHDSKVGIKIAKLNEYNGISTFLTTLDVGKSVTPHFHKEGVEHYHIIQGHGTLHLKNMLDGTTYSLSIKAHQSFTIEENILHQLTNNGQSQLVLMFSCPETHLDIDRYFDEESY